jgi:molybdopterin/thiamine biosynthesis adenylyltransferase
MTTPASDQRRYSRQTRLAEIGPSGQAKLCEAKVAIRSLGHVRTIERRYATASGMVETEATPTVAPAIVERDAAVERLGFRHAASRDVAEGALRALVAIRATLGIGS